MSAGAPIVADATITMGATHYQVEIATGGHRLTADEPTHGGGGDAGASPFGLLLASLGACTAITLRMYAERKQWPLGAITVALAYRWQDDVPVIERSVTLAGLDAAQRARCAEIAEKTPVTRALKRGIEIKTNVQ
jgi:putative redox protein